MTIDKIEDRIRKLLRLAGNNPSAEEAAAAFSVAQELATKYALDLDALSEAPGEDAPPLPTSADIERRCVAQWKRYVAWKGALGIGVAEANFCKCYRNRDGLWFYGTRKNLDAAQYMFSAIAAEVDALGKRAAARAPHYVSPKSYARAFRIGCADQITIRLREVTDRALAKAETEARRLGPNALVKVDRAREFVRANTAALEQYRRTLKLRTAPKTRVGAGYHEGRVAGNSVALDGRNRAALGTGK